MSRGRKLGIGGLVARYAMRLRFPYLFFGTATLFLLDVVWPDFVPLADEILLGLLTALFGTWRKRRIEGPGEEPPEE